MGCGSFIGVAAVEGFWPRWAGLGESRTGSGAVGRGEVVELRESACTRSAASFFSRRFDESTATNTIAPITTIPIHTSLGMEAMSAITAPTANRRMPPALLLVLLAMVCQVDEFGLSSLLTPWPESGIIEGV